MSVFRKFKVSNKLFFLIGMLLIFMVGVSTFGIYMLMRIGDEIKEIAEEDIRNRQFQPVRIFLR